MSDINHILQSIKNLQEQIEDFSLLINYNQEQKEDAERRLEYANKRLKLLRKELGSLRQNYALIHGVLVQVSMLTDQRGGFSQYDEVIDAVKRLQERQETLESCAEIVESMGTEGYGTLAIAQAIRMKND